MGKNTYVDYDKVDSAVNNCKASISGLMSGSFKKHATDIGNMANTKGASVNAMVDQLNKDNDLATALYDSLTQFVDSIDKVIENMRVLDKNMGNSIKTKR